MNAPRREQGLVLLVGLIILVVLSLLAIGSIRSTTLEERMTGNSQDQQIAFQVAEAALREAEMILGQPMLPAFVEVGDAAAAGFYLADPPDGDAPETVYRPLWLRIPWRIPRGSWTLSRAPAGARLVRCLIRPWSGKTI